MPKKKVKKVVFKPLDSNSSVEIVGDIKATPLKGGGVDYHVTKDGTDVTIKRKGEKQEYKGLPRCSHIIITPESVTVMFQTEVEVKKPKKKPVKKAKRVR